LKICKEFVKKIATQKDAIDRYYKMFYNDNKCVFSHLKLRQDKDNPLYEYEILGKKIHINNENKTHIFGPFDNVFDYRLSNEEISTKLFKESDHHSNIIKQLENNPVCIIGLGQSGSGKTSTLIKLDTPSGEVQNGILIYLLQELHKSYTNIDSMTVSVTEIKLKSVVEIKLKQVVGKKTNQTVIRNYPNINKHTVKDYIDVASNGTEIFYNTETQDLIKNVRDYINIKLDSGNRLQMPTTNNIQSSRSHIIIQLSFQSYTETTCPKNLYICDLAGVENEFDCNVSSKKNNGIFIFPDMELYELLLSFSRCLKKYNKVVFKTMLKKEMEPQEIQNLITIINKVDITSNEYNRVKNKWTRNNVYNGNDRFHFFFLHIFKIESSGDGNRNTNKLDRALGITDNGSSNANLLFKALLKYCTNRTKEGFFINHTLQELNNDIIKLIKFKNDSIPFFYDNLIDAGCRNYYKKINYFKIMDDNLKIQNNNEPDGYIMKALKATSDDQLKMHIVTVANNSAKNKQRIQYKYDLNKLKYKKITNDILSRKDEALLSHNIANNSQTLLGSIEVMEQLSNFMFNKISCIRDAANPTKYLQKYLKYKIKYFNLKNKSKDM
jgi:hypothetical protein